MMHSIFSFCSTLLDNANFNNLTVFVGLGVTLVLYVVSFITKSHQLRSYVPTIWTSLGIFFTFCAIYYGLKGFDPNETDVVSKLISEIVKAFTTSIIGIAGAVFFAIVNKVILAIQEKKNNDKFDGINWFGGIDADTPELLLFKIISIINQKGDSIENELKVLNTNQASIAKKTEDIYSKFYELLNKLYDNTNTRIVGQTNEIHAGFELLGKTMESTNVSLNNALSTQKMDFINAIEKIKGAFLETLSNQNTVLESKLSSLQNTLDSKIETMNTRNEVFVNKLIDLTKEKLVEESKKRNEELKHFIEIENGDIRQFIEKQEESYQSIKVNLEQTVSDIRQLFNEDIKQLSMESITQCNNNLVDKSKEYLESHMQSVNGYIDDLKDQIEGTRKAFEESIGALPEAMSQKLEELHEKETNLIDSTIKSNQGNVARLLDENKKAIETVANGIKDDYENIKKELKTSQDNWKVQADKIEEENLAKIEAINNATKKKIQAINDSVVAFGDEIKGVFDGIKEKIEASIKDNTDTLGRLLKANEGAINAVANEINGNNELLRTSLGDIKDEINKSINEFNSSQHRIKENAVNENEKLLMDIREKVKESFQISELEDSTKKLVQSINEILNGFKLQTGCIKDNLEKVEKSINDSAEKHAEAIRNYDEKVKYVGSVIDLFKVHITDMAILQIVLEKLNANQVVKELKDDASKKQEEKQKSNKH